MFGNDFKKFVFFHRNRLILLKKSSIISVIVIILSLKITNKMKVYPHNSNDSWKFIVVILHWVFTHSKVRSIDSIISYCISHLDITKFDINTYYFWLAWVWFEIFFFVSSCFLIKSIYKCLCFTFSAGFNTFIFWRGWKSKMTILFIDS